MIDNILNIYDRILRIVAEITVNTLEIIGIFIIIFGSFKVLVQTIKRYKNKEADPPNVVIALGRTLALALEFKMGAEIVNTVIIKDLQELAVLAIVIVLRALLALLIHWEIKNEKNEENEHAIEKGQEKVDPSDLSKS